MNDPTQRTLEDMAADLELSEAQAARGETVPVTRVLARLDASIRPSGKNQVERHSNSADCPQAAEIERRLATVDEDIKHGIDADALEMELDRRYA